MPYKDPIKAKEQMRERTRRWRLANPDKAKAATKKFTAEELQKVLDEEGF